MNAPLLRRMATLPLERPPVESLAGIIDDPLVHLDIWRIALFPLPKSVTVRKAYSDSGNFTNKVEPPGEAMSIGRLIFL